MDAIDRRAGLAERLDLGRALAHAQLAQDGAGRDLLGTRQRGAEPQCHDRPHAVGDADARHVAGQPGGHQRERVVGLAPGHHLHAQGAGRGRLRRRQLQPGHHEERLAAGGHHQTRQPFELDRVIARDVAQVGPGGQEHRTEARTGHGLPHPREAIGLER